MTDAAMTTCVDLAVQDLAGKMRCTVTELFDENFGWTRAWASVTFGRLINLCMAAGATPDFTDPDNIDLVMAHPTAECATVACTIHDILRSMNAQAPMYMDDLDLQGMVGTCIVPEWYSKWQRSLCFVLCDTERLSIDVPGWEATRSLLVGHVWKALFCRLGPLYVAPVFIVGLLRDPVTDLQCEWMVRGVIDTVTLDDVEGDVAGHLVLQRSDTSPTEVRMAKQFLEFADYDDEAYDSVITRGLNRIRASRRVVVVVLRNLEGIRRKIEINRAIRRVRLVLDSNLLRIKQRLWRPEGRLMLVRVSQVSE
jgi:hypothetical protein